MGRAEKQWKALWAKETRPRHAEESERFYQSYASELSIIIGDAAPLRVLELGCGTGALYPYLHFDKSKLYRGIDFSDTMLAQFKKQHTSVEVKQANGESYRDSDTYDLIFSNGVVQNFTPQMFDTHLANAKAMLAPDGRIVDAMIPWRPARRSYCSGALLQSPNAGALRYLKVRAALQKDGLMGWWYDAAELAALGRKHDLSVKFYGSLHYPYRIHAAFRHAS
jgi:cyclopropane fatty-acyl-phospholipid synthase-like methyltransferase